MTTDDEATKIAKINPLTGKEIQKIRDKVAQANLKNVITKRVGAPVDASIDDDEKTIFHKMDHVPNRISEEGLEKTDPQDNSSQKRESSLPPAFETACPKTVSSQDNLETNVNTQNVDSTQNMADDEKTMLHQKQLVDVPKNKITEEFIPRYNAKPTGELTTLWQEENKIDNYIKNFKAKKSKKRILIISSCALMVLIVIATAIAKKTSTNASPEIELIADDIDTAFEAQKKKSVKNDPKLPDKEVSLLKAATALANGHIDQALMIYRALEKKYPDNPSYSLAVEIIELDRAQK
jgi:hypothetical protein